MMVEMVEYLVKSIVDKPAQVKVSFSEQADKKIVHVIVASSDLPRVIGSDGKIFRAIRGLVAIIGSTKQGNEYDLVVDVVA